LLADTLVGTLSATDVDTDDDALTFTTNSADFEIVNGNKLTNLNAIHKTIGTKTAFLLVFMTNIR
jgi:hypothetical protein